MPFLNKDGSIDKHNGYIVKCDCCGIVEVHFDEDKDEITIIGDKFCNLHVELMRLFKGVRKDKCLNTVLCFKCLAKFMPNYYKLRDVIELDIFVNKLKGAINERRKQNKSNQNNRTT